MPAASQPLAIPLRRRRRHSYVFVFCVTCGCLFLNSFFSSYTFSLTVIIATGNQLDGLSLLEACQMKLSYDTGIVYLLW